MTVTATPSVSNHIGNGVSTVFAYGFKILQASDLLVKVDGVVVTNYTVAGVRNPDGGSITFSAPPASLAKIRIARNMAFARATDYQFNGNLPSDTLDDDQDAPVMMIQQVAEVASRAIVAPETDQVTLNPLPDIETRKGKILGFDAVTGQPSVIISAFQSAVELALSLASTIGASLVGFIQAGTGGIATTIQEVLRRRVDLWDYGVVGNGVADDTTAVSNAINRANALSVPLYCSKPGTFRINSTLPTFTASPGLIADLEAGDVVFHHYATTSCLVLKGSYKKLQNFTVINKSAPGTGTTGAACVQVINCAYGEFKNVYTAHDLDAYSGFLLEHQYDGSAADAAFIAHLGCWYNNLSGVNALYASLAGGTRGFGVVLSVNANARGVVNPPGEAPGTYTGSIRHNIIDNSNIEARSQGMRFDLSNNNTVRGGQFLGCSNQVRLIDSQQNVFVATRHNQWLTNPVLSSGTSARNVFLYPSLFNVTAPPWTMGTLAATDTVLHFGDGTTEAWKAFTQIDLQAGQLKFPAVQNASTDANTLDDYEEGAWTPTLTFGGNATGMMFAQRGGTYIKIGRLVVVSFDIRLSAKGSSVGAAAIGGLPFASSGVAGDGYGCANLRLYSGMSGAGRIGNGYSYGSTTITELCDHSINLTDTNFTNTSIVFGSMSYIAAS